MSVQAQELRDKLAHACAEAARQAARAEEASKRCAVLEEMRDHEAGLRVTLAAEKAHVAGLLSTAQHRTEQLQRVVEEAQQQVQGTRAGRG